MGVNSCYSICRVCTRLNVAGYRTIGWRWTLLRHLTNSRRGKRGTTKIEGITQGGEVSLTLTDAVVWFQVGILVDARVM